MRAVFAVLSLLFLAACGGESKWASDEAVQNAAYVHDGPPMITLFTVISNRSGSGAHAALMINGSQRILFDPAGSWYHPRLPERNDVHFGITDPAVDFYVDYHSRITYHLVRQDIVVSPEVAEIAIREALAHGAAPKATCTIAVTKVLNNVPGFESLSRTYFPKQSMKEFGQLPGVTEQIFYDDDPDRNEYHLVTGI